MRPRWLVHDLIKASCYIPSSWRCDFGYRKHKKKAMHLISIQKEKNFFFSHIFHISFHFTLRFSYDYCYASLTVFNVLLYGSNIRFFFQVHFDLSFSVVKIFHFFNNCQDGELESIPKSNVKDAPDIFMNL